MGMTKSLGTHVEREFLFMHTVRCPIKLSFTFTGLRSFINNAIMFLSSRTGTVPLSMTSSAFL